MGPEADLHHPEAHLQQADVSHLTAAAPQPPSTASPAVPGLEADPSSHPFSCTQAFGVSPFINQACSVTLLLTAAIQQMRSPSLVLFPGGD